MEAIVFDFDGTIVDTEETWFRSVELVYQEHDVALDAVWWGTMIGTRVDAVAEALAALHHTIDRATAFTRLEQRVRANHRELSTAQAIRPGVGDLLDECEAVGIPVAIATNADRPWVEHNLRLAGLSHRFTTIVPVEEVRSPKPHPDVYLVACERLGVDPARSVAIEDSPTGLASAIAAGLFTVAAPTRLTAQFGFDGAHLRVDSLANVGVGLLKRMLSER